MHKELGAQWNHRKYFKVYNPMKSMENTGWNKFTDYIRNSSFNQDKHVIGFLLKHKIDVYMKFSLELDKFCMGKMLEKK